MHKKQKGANLDVWGGLWPPWSRRCPPPTIWCLLRYVRILSSGYENVNRRTGCHSTCSEHDAWIARVRAWSDGGDDHRPVLQRVLLTVEFELGTSVQFVRADIEPFETDLQRKRNPCWIVESRHPTISRSLTTQKFTPSQDPIWDGP